MKLITITLALAAFLPLAAEDKKANVLLQAAQSKETVQGDLKGAIELYGQAVKEAGANRALAAKTLVQMAECYQKLGDAESGKIYERVVRDFADQKEAAAEARTRLAALKASAAALPAHPSQPSGMVARQVWAGFGVDVLGSVSPDGNFLSFVDWNSGDLALRDLSTGQNRRITTKGSWNINGFAMFSRISPDGKQIVYNWLNEKFGWDIRIGPLDNPAHRTLYSTDSNDQYAEPGGWSPDGKHFLALLPGGDRSNRIAVMSATDGSVRVLKTTDWRTPGTLQFSPDGKYIVYDFPPREDSPERDIYVLAADASREVRMVEHPANDLLLGWAPDGLKILFTSDRGGSTDAWAIPVAEGRPQGPPELIKKDLGLVFFPLGFTRGGSFYYGMSVGSLDVFTAPLDPHAGKIVGPAERVAQRFIGTNTNPEWSPDGQYLAYISGRGRHPGARESRVLCITSLETGKQREFPLGLLGYINRPRWSPDGRSILLGGKDEKGRKGLFLLDVEADRTTTVVLDPWLAPPAWSRDGKSIFFVRHRQEPPNGTGQVSRIIGRNLETGEETELFRETASSLVGDGMVNDLTASPDGRTLAFTVTDGRDLRSLRVIPTAGGESREVFRAKKGDPNIPFYGGVGWTPDGKRLVFVRARLRIQDNHELWSIPVEGGEPAPLGLAMRDLQEPRIHPSGKRIAVRAGRDAREVWALENFLPGAMPAPTTKGAPAPALRSADSEKAVRHLNQTRAAFLASIRDLSPAQWSFKPAPDAWSMAEVAEHVTAYESVVLELIEKDVLAVPAGPAQTAEARGKDELALKGIDPRTELAVWGDFLPQPLGRWGQAELPVRFHADRERTIELVRATPKDLRGHIFPDPILGTIDAYQCFLLMAAHTQRHTAQIEEIKALAGFPKK